ncbi:signal transduction histidine-protein kinase BaeS [Enterobacter cloacae]|uniref:Signal transduction histidine-protein kinase BaeS n=1 Tax=Enterobacter cloacae TaxID=550 RepID=A0A377LX83_ENTCL|nr:signal transduction histidine-protein kinase BaeS [Enterobacter cloacae]
MKFWRPGITGKLFLAIFATCIVLLITMHWAVRLSFERGFIDYIKHGNEQRLQGLSDALSEQYAQHGNWRFLRNNDRFIFQILRSLEHDSGDDRPGPGNATPWLAHPVLGDRPGYAHAGWPSCAHPPGRHPAGNQSE